MVKPVKRRALHGWVMALALMSVSVMALAQTLDPTKPPAALSPAEQGDGAPAAPVGPVLQSVLISYGVPARRIAVISGQTVKIGDKVGEATVLSIVDGQVVLRTGRERQTLKLYPDLDKPGSGKPAGVANDKKADMKLSRPQEMKPQDAKQDNKQDK